jgi:hypothetical protein
MQRGEVVLMHFTGDVQQRFRANVTKILVELSYVNFLK